MAFTKEQRRKRRHFSLRKRVSGTPERPRLVVHRSLKHIYAQIIDDTSGTTLATASTLTPEVAKGLKTTGNIKAAEAVGKHLAGLAKEKGIERVVYDRGGNLYHGRIKALADGAREGGLQL